jgi:hypothetical protein
MSSDASKNGLAPGTVSTDFTQTAAGSLLTANGDY